MHRDYFMEEKERNQRADCLFRRLIQGAFGSKYQVFVGHHIVFQLVEGGVALEKQEVVSADALVFDPDIMEPHFGKEGARVLMAQLAVLLPMEREVRVQEALDALEAAGPWVGDAEPSEVRFPDGHPRTRWPYTNAGAPS